MSLPQYIILPTEDAVADFRVDVRQMTNHDYDMGEIICDVFKSLTLRNECRDRISILCKETVHNYDRAGARDDGVVLANAFGNLAHKVYEIFQQGDAWDSLGVLRLMYYNDIGDNWVVEVDHSSSRRTMAVTEGKLSRCREGVSETYFTDLFECTTNNKEEHENNS